ncbi:hypothetical protein BSY16_6284 (plasmid) [Sinorhizobium sp. RAC02]|nr:hypothetical protein BSY16_6284 [Sinorhizobium sp. RAC02]
MNLAVRFFLCFVSQKAKLARPGQVAAAACR